MNKKSSLQKMIDKDYEEVKTWAKWKQSITISAETASTGQFFTKLKEKK